MRDTGFRRAAFFILLLCFVMRLGFLVFGDVLPVMWDARRYAAGAIGLISLVDSSGPGEPATEREDRYRFKHYYEKYIQGEQIDWLSYAPHSLSQAREELFISGPLYPAVLAALFLASPVEDFTVARVLGIILDTLALLLLLAVGVRLVGRFAALLAALVYAVYFPFILASSMLLLETSTTLLILLTLYLLVRAVEANSNRTLVCAGLVAGALILNKPTAMLLAIPFAAGSYFYTRGSWPPRVFVHRMLYFITPAVVILIAWGIVASTYYGQPTLRDPEYAEANLRQSTSIVNEGYGLDRVDESFWTRSVSEDILSNPTGFAGLVIKKFDRLWRRPYNDFRQSFLIPYAATEFLHLAVVVLGLVGLLVLLRTDLGRGAWPLLLIAYYTGIHVIFHSVSRYNFQAMPMVLLAAAFFVVTTREACRKNKAGARCLLAAFLLLVAWLFDASWINAVFGSGLNERLVALAVAIRAALFFAGLTLLFGVLRTQCPRLGRFAIPLAATVVVTLSGIATVFPRDRWAEFPCRLSDGAMKAGTRIFISDFRPVNSGDFLAVVADIKAGPAPAESFTIRLDSAACEYTAGQPPMTDYFYPKPTYDYYARFIPMGTDEFRQWVYCPVDAGAVRRSLADNGYVDVAAVFHEANDSPDAAITLWGQYETGRETPFIPHYRITSIERFVHEDAPRIRLAVKYLSDSTVSYYIGRDESDIRGGGDLSPRAGRQTGRYNLYLMHFRPDGEVLIY